MKSLLSGFVPLIRLLVGTLLIFAAQTTLAASNSDLSADHLLTADLTREQREDLLARLSDEDVRGIVWQLIEAQSQQEPAPDPVLEEFITLIDQFRRNLTAELQQIPVIAVAPGIIARAMVPPGKSQSFLFLVPVYLAGLFLVGWAAQRLFSRATQRVPQTLTASGGRSFPERLARRALLLGYECLRPVIFTVASFLIFLILYQGHEPNRVLMIQLLAGFFSTWFVVLLFRFLFSPRYPGSRLVPLGDDDARLVSSRLSLVTGLAVVIYFIQSYLAAISQNEPLIRAFSLASGSGLVVLTVIIIWLIRKPVTSLLLSGRTPGLARKILAPTWPIIATVIVLLLLVAGLFAALGLGRTPTGAGFKTLLLLFVLPFVLGAIGPLVREWGRGREESVPGRSNIGLREAVVRITRLATLVLAIGMLGHIWDIDLASMTTSTLGTQISATGFQIAATLTVAYVLWMVVSQMTNSGTADESDDEEHAGGGDAGGPGLSRAATLLPLFRSFLLVAIITVSVMVILSGLGVNIGPLIAAASVFGLAIGFGAQTLVADIISGVFFLIDDAFRKGEYIDVGGSTGTVEQISVRSMQLRHHNGPVHTIPYSRISTLTNFSRDWVIMKFELRIPFEEDVEKVRKLIKKVGQELLKDEEHGPQFLDALKSQGVNRMDDSAFVVRCKFSAKPGNQWALRRVAYAKIQEAFARADIKFAPKRVVVEAITPDLAAAGAAVSTTTDEAGKDR